MAKLHKFKNDLTAGTGEGAVKQPPFVIRARDLDSNFSMCFPMPIDGRNAPYVIERSADNYWRLRGGKEFDVCENGKPVKYKVFAERMRS
jgi:hypothetical protein